MNPDLSLYYTNEENKDFYLYKQQTNKLIYYRRDIQTVLDTRGALRCVRFDSGNAGEVTTKENTKLVVGPFQQ